MTDPYRATPAYLCGALLSDGVRPDQAVRIAEGYEAAFTAHPDTMDVFLEAVLTHLPTLGVTGYPATTMCRYAYMSEHDLAKYEALASEAGFVQKERR